MTLRPTYVAAMVAEIDEGSSLVDAIILTGATTLEAARAVELFDDDPTVPPSMKRTLLAEARQVLSDELRQLEGPDRS